MGGTATYTVILIITTLLSKALGFVREMSLSSVYGAGYFTDAYKVAYTLPTILFSGICAATLTGYISLYTELKERDPKKLQDFSDNVITLVFLLSVVVMGLFLLLKNQVVKLFAVGFPPEVHALSVQLAQVMMLSVLFIGVYFIFQGFLQVRGSFLAVGLVSVPLNLAIIAVTLLIPPEQYMGMAWGVVAGYGLSFVMLLAAALRRGFRYRPRLDLKDPYLRRLLRMVLPIFLGKMVVDLSTLADQTIASILPEGGVTVLSYGNRVIGTVTAVFVTSLTTALFPQLSQLSASRSRGRMKHTFRTSVGIMSLLVIPITAGLMVFSQQVAILLYGGGDAMTPENITRIGQVIFYYAMGLIFFSIKNVMINMFYALQDTKTPTINTILALVLNILLNLALIKPLAHIGLALATSLSGAVTMVTLMISLRRKMGPLGLRQLFISLLKMGIATLGMVLAVVPVYDFLIGRELSMLLSLAVAVVVGVLTYLVLGILLRIRELGIFIVGVVERLTPRRHG